MIKNKKKLLMVAISVVITTITLAKNITVKAETTQDNEIKNILQEYLPKLDKNISLPTNIIVNDAAQRIFNKKEVTTILNKLTEYEDIVYIDEVKKLLDEINKFIETKNMEVYDNILNNLLPTMKNKEVSEYVKGQLAKLGQEEVFKYDDNYSKATDEIIKVTKLRELGLYKEALCQSEIAKEAINNIKTYKQNSDYLMKVLNYEIQTIDRNMNLNSEKPSIRFLRNKLETIHVCFNKEMDINTLKNTQNYNIEYKEKYNSNTDNEISIQIIDNKNIEIKNELKEPMVYISFSDNITDINGNKMDKGEFKTTTDKMLKCMINSDNEDGYLKDEDIDDDIDLEKIKSQLIRLNPNIKVNDIVAYKSMIEGISYDILQKWSNEYIGKRVGFSGKVQQVIYENEKHMEVLVDVNDYSADTKTKIIKVTYDNKENKKAIKKGDSIEFYGIYKGKESKENSPRIPSVKATIFETI